MPNPITRLAVIAAAAGALMAAGCSSESTPPQESTPQQSSTSAPTGHGAFAHCLSEHGVPAAPGPATGPPPGVDADTWQRAMQSCSTLAPGPGPGPG